jgi:hypothetical protein
MCACGSRLSFNLHRTACHPLNLTQVHTLAKYFMELKALSYGMVRFTPSETAAAAIFVARKVCDETAVWVRSLIVWCCSCRSHIVRVYLAGDPLSYP